MTPLMHVGHYVSSVRSAYELPMYALIMWPGHVERYALQLHVFCRIPLYRKV